MVTRGADTARPRPWRTAAILALAGAVAVGLVALVHDLAQPRIEASRRAQRIAELTAVLGALPYDNDPLADAIALRDPELLGTAQAVTAYRVRRAGQPVAVLLNAVAPDGYSGAIRLLVAIDPSGALIGVRVVEHRETPGLGDWIDLRRSEWIRSFDGRSLGDPPPERWRVRKDGGDFDQFTGATITPRAIVAAVRNALVFFERNRPQLLAPPSATVATP